MNEKPSSAIRPSAIRPAPHDGAWQSETLLVHAGALRTGFGEPSEALM